MSATAVVPKPGIAQASQSVALPQPLFKDASDAAANSPTYGGTSPSSAGSAVASPTVVGSSSPAGGGVGPYQSPESTHTTGTVDPNSGQPGKLWVPASQPTGELKVPGSGDVAVTIPQEIPQAVSEEGQAKKKEEAYQAEQTGWFKQNLQKVKRNLFGPLHVGDALFTAWIIMWIIITAAANQGGVQYFWLFIFLLSYFAYLHWNWKSDERLHFWTMMGVDDFEGYWKNLRTRNPVISMRVECWHYERRVSQHTSYNANTGTSTTTTTVTYVRVVSHTELEHFNYRLCADLSLDVQGSDLAKNNATFVSLWKELRFGDVQTATAYAIQLATLKARNINRDTFMDCEEWMEIPTWTRACGVYKDPASRPILLRGWIFVTACVMLLSWPIKIYGEFVAKKGGFYMVKQVHL